MASVTHRGYISMNSIPRYMPHATTVGPPRASKCNLPKVGMVSSCESELLKSGIVSQGPRALEYSKPTILGLSSRSWLAHHRYYTSTLPYLVSYSSEFLWVLSAQWVSFIHLWYSLHSDPGSIRCQYCRNPNVAQNRSTEYIYIGSSIIKLSKMVYWRIS